MPLPELTVVRVPLEDLLNPRPDGRATYRDYLDDAVRYALDLMHGGVERDVAEVRATERAVALCAVENPHLLAEFAA